MIFNSYIATTHKENVDGAGNQTLYDTFTPVLRSDLERERERERDWVPFSYILS
jgi:hypothetical protein